MPKSPVVIAFDVIETLFSLEPLRARLESAQLPSDQLELLFAKILRDGFALSAIGAFQPFSQLAAGTFAVFLADHGQKVDDAKIENFLQGFGELPAHPDVAPAFEMLRAEDIRILALTNGGAGNTKTLLKNAQLDSLVEQVISIDEIGHWKPDAEVYRHAAQKAGVKTEQMALVAAHAWDVHGAQRAGLITGWVQRQETIFHPALPKPDVSGENLSEVCQRLLALN